MPTQKQIEDALMWQAIWGDNSDLSNNEKGIISFSRMVFPDHIKSVYGISDVHRHIYEDVLNLWSGKLRFLVERQEQIIVHREGAKSTVVLGIILPYIMCFNGIPIILPNGERITFAEDLVAVCSETNTFATNWTRRARGSISRKYVKHVFGNIKDANIEDEDGKWQEGSFKLSKENLPYPFTGKNLSILSRGVGQQIRGINQDGRITTALIDDIYSKNNITTVESRGKVRYWFTAETKNSIDKNAGKVVCIGTVVHEDTVIVENQNSKFWKTLKYPIMDKDKFNEVLDKHCTVNIDQRICIIPNSGECEALEKQGYTTNWPVKFPLEMLLLMYSEAVEGMENKGLTMFFQEYFHEVIAESDKKITKDMMRTDDFDFELGHVGDIPYTFVKMSNGDRRQVNTVLSVDAAWSYEKTADDSCIGWIGMDFQARIYSHTMKSGKFAINDEFHDDKDYLTYATKLCTDLSKIKRIGLSDEIFRMAPEGHRITLVVETNTGAIEIVRQIYRKMTLYGRRFNLIEVPQTIRTGNKIQRILDNLALYYQSRAVYHRPGQRKLQDQLEFIQSTKNDDEADVLSTGVANLQKPLQLIMWQDKDKLPKKQKDNFFTRLRNPSQAPARSAWKTR